MLYPKVVSIVIIPVVLSLGIVFMYYIVILNWFYSGGTWENTALQLEFANQLDFVVQ